jgi:hypothetical protein
MRLRVDAGEGRRKITVVWDAEEGLFSLDQSVEQPYALSNP